MIFWYLWAGFVIDCLFILIVLLNTRKRDMRLISVRKVLLSFPVFMLLWPWMLPYVALKSWWNSRHA